MVLKKSENLENLSRKEKKKFSKNLNFLKIFFFSKKKNAILLVSQYKEDTIQPKLSGPARFRIQGGGLLSLMESGQKFSCLILDYYKMSKYG